MGKWFDYSEILRKKDLPTLTYTNGRITISKHLKKSEIYNESRKDLPLFYIKDGEPVIEKSVLNAHFISDCCKRFKGPTLPEDKRKIEKLYDSPLSKWKAKAFS